MSAPVLTTITRQGGRLRDITTCPHYPLWTRSDPRAGPSGPAAIAIIIICKRAEIFGEARCRELFLR